MNNPRRHLGYHDREAMAALPVKKGDRVRIPKGVVFKQVGKDAKAAGRSYVVTVHHLLPGRSSYVRDILTPLENPKVCWAGSGGYWCEADVNDVDPVKP